ncbi:DUF397 domain-containing protein [Micromonospora sp. LOL_028]|uniref:DUF397 domain-containing protein n=1 Tax=Micromonospora sp. LOL_028 TaxID=3345420 RepID=UPI003A853352
MNACEIPAARWFESSRSNGQNNCVEAAAGAVVAEGACAIVQSACDHDLSWPVVAAALTAYEACLRMRGSAILGPQFG